MHNPRFIPLPHSPYAPAVLMLDSRADLVDTFNCAQQRLRLACQLLTAIEGADDCDLRPLGAAAHRLLQDGCGLLELADAHLNAPPP